MLNRISFLLVISAIFIFAGTNAHSAEYVESNTTTTVHYNVDVNGSYVLWFDQLLAQDADIDTALSVCESLDGLYDAELDECTVDALPLYVETVGANLDYFVHVL